MLESVAAESLDVVALMHRAPGAAHGSPITASEPLFPDAAITIALWLTANLTAASKAAEGSGNGVGKRMILTLCATA